LRDKDDQGEMIDKKRDSAALQLSVDWGGSLNISKVFSKKGEAEGGGGGFYRERGFNSEKSSGAGKTPLICRAGRKKEKGRGSAGGGGEGTRECGGKEEICRQRGKDSKRRSGTYIEEKVILGGKG